MLIEAQRYALERMGVKIRILRGQQTYMGLFTGRITRGPKKGLLRSFPICGRCAVQRDCKLKPILRYQKSLPPDTVQYIGIARDEQDMNREVAPLRQAEDAILVDSSDLSIDEVVERIKECYREVKQ